MAIDGLSLLLPSPPSCATEFSGPIVLCGVGVGLENHLPISSGKMPLKKNSFSFRDIVFTKVLAWENSLNKEGLFCPNDKINVFQNG